MAETIISPGVYLNENDQSFVTTGVVSTGAVIVGPTNKGPAFIPTVVRSTSEFNNTFGGGLQYNKTVTYVPQTVDSYLKSPAGSVMVLRVLGGGGFKFDSDRKLAAIVESGSNTVISVLYPSLNDDVLGLSGSNLNGSQGDSSLAVSISGSYVLGLSGSNFGSQEISASFNPNASDYILNILGDQPNNTNVEGEATAFTALNFRTWQSENTGSDILLVTSSWDIEFTGSTAEGYDHGRTPWVTSGDSNKELFKIHHRGDGFDTNNDVYVSISGLREPADVNGVPQYSTFDVLVRKVGTDAILESFNNCDLNPLSPNFIAKKIGDRYEEYNVDLGKVLRNGEFKNASQFVRIELSNEVRVGALSPRLSPRGHSAYYDTTGFAISAGPGILTGAPSASLRSTKVVNSVYAPNAFLGIDFTNPDYKNYLKPVPTIDGYAKLGRNVVFNIDSLEGHASASWNGSLSASIDTAGVTGPTSAQVQFSVAMQFGNDGVDYQTFKKVGAAMAEDGGANAFGMDLRTTSTPGGKAYKKATDILSNKDRYDFNIISTPGVIDELHHPVTNQTLNMVEERADAIYAMDLTEINANVVTAKNQTDDLDSSYAAVYYPWIQMANVDSGAPEYFPPSVVMPGVYQKNDNIAAPWFAPAGLTRGGIQGVIQAKNPLTKTERDILYAERVNPIATFPQQGVVVFGQKTTQRVASALDRVNVRRLLINIKKFVDAQSRFLVFEQNTSATQERFKGLVNPYLKSVKDRQGLYDYRVVMDETNNTPDVIDRNELIGAIYIQPTKTAEFIKIDFNIQVTGAQI
ncbi:phage tail sheath subtilisin-like domain-containing protein [bacterium]|nr:phage tail sheath subtilisin-like domain-containing protein [bacterium]